MIRIDCVADIARLHAKERGAQAALWFQGRETSYAEFDALSNRCANALLSLGLKPLDRIGHLAKGNDDFFILWFGALKARVCLTPVNWRLAPPEMAFILKDAGARALFVGADYDAAAAGLLPDLQEIGKTIRFEPGHAEWPDFRAWIAGFPDTDPRLPSDPQDDVIQLYTSGTTGLPKGVMLTETNYLAAFESAMAVWAKMDAGDRVLVCMPLFHVAGANMGMLGLLQGATCVVLKESDPGSIIDSIGEHGIKKAIIVPALINMILQHPKLDGADLSSMTDVYYGASPISEEVLQRARKRFGADFTQLYGLTETMGMATYLPPDAHEGQRLRSCGRPSPGCEVRVMVDGRQAEVGEVGEIEIRSAGVMKGYWNRPDATNEAIDADGWFKSGDAGYFDEEGFLYIHDRVKDMIVSGGENVYPAEVENAIFSHPAVADAAVIGVPDQRWGEAVKAVVVLRPGASLEPEELIAHCRARIAGYKIPRSMDVIDALPRNPSGKVLRRELRKPYWEGHGRLVG